MEQDKNKMEQDKNKFENEFGIHQPGLEKFIEYHLTMHNPKTEVDVILEAIQLVQDVKKRKQYHKQLIDILKQS